MHLYIHTHVCVYIYINVFIYTYIYVHNHTYPLVNVYITNWKITTFNGKTRYFYGHFSIAFCLFTR